MKQAIVKSPNGSVAKAFDLLECFTVDKPYWGVTELAKKLNFNKSTTYRLLASLEQQGILHQDQESMQYALGLKLFELGNRVHLKTAFVEKSNKELERVANTITETVHIAVLQNKQVIIIDKIESPLGLKLNSNIGNTFPLHASSLGKTLLAYHTRYDKKRFEELLAEGKLETYTPNTITSKSILWKEIQSIPEKGFAIDMEEYELGLICIAVPILNKKGTIIAALSASGPASRFKKEKVPEYVSIIQSGAHSISQAIGDFKL